jgi:hypothetical protein
MTNQEYAKSVIDLLDKNLLEKYIELYDEKAPNMFFLTRFALNAFIISQKIGNLKTLGVSYPDDVMYALNDLIDTSIVILGGDQDISIVKSFVEEFKNVVGDLVQESVKGNLTINVVASKMDKLKDFIS